MKTAKLTLMCLACAAAIPAFAQNTTDSRCGMTNFDRNQSTFTITNPNMGAANQQCFITVVPKDSWAGGAPDMGSSQIVEGNYQITLAGGGGGGGGGADAVNRRNSVNEGGDGGSGALPFTGARYLSPGVYRLTIGAGGQGGTHNGGRGADGAPTSLSNAHSGETIAGYPRAEYWNGSYPVGSPAYSGGAKGADGRDGGRLMAFQPAGGSGGGSGARAAGENGTPGGHGFIRLAALDPVQPARAREIAPVQFVPAQPARQAAPAAFVEPARTVRPARRDRN